MSPNRSWTHHVYATFVVLWFSSLLNRPGTTKEIKIKCRRWRWRKNEKNICIELHFINNIIWFMLKLYKCTYTVYYKNLFCHGILLSVWNIRETDLFSFMLCRWNFLLLFVKVSHVSIASSKSKYDSPIVCALHIEAFWWRVRLSWCFPQEIILCTAWHHNSCRLIFVLKIQNMPKTFSTTLGSHDSLIEGMSFICSHFHIIRFQKILLQWKFHVTNEHIHNIFVVLEYCSVCCIFKDLLSNSSYKSVHVSTPPLQIHPFVPKLLKVNS